MDEHRKVAEEVLTKWCDRESLLKAIEEALRTIASKSEKDGWNKAVEECAKQIETHWNCSTTMTNQKDQAYRSADAIRRLIREDGKMIEYKSWVVYDLDGNFEYNYDGWFLFGTIPLYIRRFK